MNTMTEPMMTLLRVDPNTLELNPGNVRKKAGGIDQLAESVAEVGVLVPLIVRHSTVGGRYVVVAGERRALAALKARVATVPVIVRTDMYSEQAEVTAMLVENLHREGLTAADEAKGYEQLAAFGVNAAEIAQLTGRDAKRITAGLTVAKSPAACEVAVTHPLSFDHLAVIAEFDGDKKAVEKLVDRAERDPRYFDHLVQDLRRDAKRKEKGKAERERLKAAGVKVISKPFGYDLSSTSGVLLASLKDAAGEAISTAAHKKCPGHAASITYDGTAAYGCTDPTKYGHKAQPGRATSSPASTKKPGPAQEAAAKAQAAQDAEAIDASTIVRRKFVRELLGRKVPPKGMLAFTVPMMIADGAGDLYLQGGDDRALVAEFTGIKPASIDRSQPAQAFLELTDGANDARLQMVLFCWVVTCIESAWAPSLLTPQSWEIDEVERAAAYLRYLDSCGYGLSDIEQRIITTAAPKEAKKAKRAR